MKIPATWNDEPFPILHASEEEYVSGDEGIEASLKESASSLPLTRSFSSLDSDSENGDHRAVRFVSTLNEIREIPNLDTFSGQELRGSWFGEMDYRYMKREALETLTLNRMAGGFLEEDYDDDEHEQDENMDPNHRCPQQQQQQRLTMRGLECRTREGARYRKQLRMIYVDSVLREQNRQRWQGSSNTELLAAIARNLSSECRYSAMTRGVQDERVVTPQQYPSSLDTTSSLWKGRDMSCGMSCNRRSSSRLLSPLGANTQQSLLNKNSVPFSPSSSSVLSEGGLYHIRVMDLDSPKADGGLFLGLDLNFVSNSIVSSTCLTSAVNA